MCENKLVQMVVRLIQHFSKENFRGATAGRATWYGAMD